MFGRDTYRSVASLSSAAERGTTKYSVLEVSVHMTETPGQRATPEVVAENSRWSSASRDTGVVAKTWRREHHRYPRER
jgi:hypothetical protein